MGEGGFTFSSSSAQDIASVITQRKAQWLRLRSETSRNVMQITSDGTHGVSEQPPPQQPREKPKAARPTNLPMESKKLLPSQEEETSTPKNTEQKKETSTGKKTTFTERTSPFAKSKEFTSLRICNRPERRVPKSQILKKAQTTIKIDDSLLTPLTPDEPRYISYSELVKYQEQYRQLKAQKDKETATAQQLAKAQQDTDTTLDQQLPESKSQSQRQEEWAQGSRNSKNATKKQVKINLPSLLEEEISSTSSTLQEMKRDVDTVLCHQDVRRAISEPSPDGMKKLSNLSSPTINHRPRSFGFSKSAESPESSLLMSYPPPLFFPPPLFHPPLLADTRRKSLSNPHLSGLEGTGTCSGSHYLTIVHSNPAPEKTPKKPVPTPRTSKPPQNNTGLHQPGSQPRPRQPLPPSQSPYLRPQVGFFSQRSLSESDLACGGGLSEEGVETSASGKRLSGTEPVYMNSSEAQLKFRQDDSPFDKLPSLPPRGLLPRRRSISTGNLPTCAFSEGSRGLLLNDYEEIYQNGEQYMEHCMYGSTGDSLDSPICSGYGDCRVVFHHGDYCEDGGMGGLRSFSMSDVRLSSLVAGGGEEEEGEKEIFDESSEDEATCNVAGSYIVHVCVCELPSCILSCV